MKLEYIQEDDLMLATDDVISEYAGDKDLYSSVEMTTTLTCGSPTIVEYQTADIEDTNNLFYLFEERIIISPGMFPSGFSSDGIYRVDIKFKDETGFTRIYNCIFVDVTFKCRLANLLTNLLDEDYNSQTAHLLHYSLINGSNCGCVCDEMCVSFNALKTILDNQPVQATDCGCN
jgi:hypothetical protein